MSQKRVFRPYERGSKGLSLTRSDQHFSAFIAFRKIFSKNNLENGIIFRKFKVL